MTLLRLQQCLQVKKQVLAFTAFVLTVGNVCIQFIDSNRAGNIACWKNSS